MTATANKIWCTCLSCTLGSLPPPLYPPGVKIPWGVLPPPWQLAPTVVHMHLLPDRMKLKARILWPWKLAHMPENLADSIPKDSLSFNRLSYWTFCLNIHNIDHYLFFNKWDGVGVRYGLGSLPSRGVDTLAWAAWLPPPENLTQLNSVSYFSL